MIAAAIKRHVGAHVVDGALVTDAMELDVRANEDADNERYAATWQDFVFAPYYLDIESKLGVPTAAYVLGVSRLLEALWSEGWDAIAACDFEEQLPRKGGLQRRD